MIPVRLRFLLLSGVLVLSACKNMGKKLTDPEPETPPIISIGNDADLALVRKYNADGNGYVRRWEQSTVGVYDQIGIPNLQDVLNDWNAAMDGKLMLVIGDSQSPITIVTNTSMSEAGLTEYQTINYRIQSVKISINTPLTNPYWIAKHELGHAIGFRGHTIAGGAMNTPMESLTITDEVKRTLRKLYDLAPGTQLVP